MILSDFIHILENEIPASIQESYDNTGLQVGSLSSTVSKALLCLDITMDVLEEARQNKCDLILSHHPLIFNSLKKIDFQNQLGQCIRFAIKNDISVYSMHTSIDKYRFGVSYVLAQKMGLKNIKVLSAEKGGLKKLVTFCPTAQVNTLRNALFNAGAGHIGQYDSCSFNLEGNGTFRALEGAHPFVGKLNQLHTEKETRIEMVFPEWKESDVIRALLAHHPYEEVAYDIYSLDNKFEQIGLGAVGDLDKAMSMNEFLSLLQNVFHQNPMRYNHFDGSIKRVACCGGSGASLIDAALLSGANAFITADIKYHDFQKASGNLLMIDAGHYETEIQVLNLMKELISEKIPTFASLISKTNTNFVKYLK